MSKTSWTLMCALHLPLLCFARSALTNSFFNDTQLYEGSPCQLRHGAGEGVCVKARNCPGVLAQIQKGDYRHICKCGFDNFDEIVCCTKSASINKDRIRPADTACEKYKEMVSELDIEGTFGIVVFNGVLAKVDEFPHMAALGYAASDDEEGAIRGMKYVCGGTLISLKHVITAAHCVSNVHGLVPVEVLLGTIDLTNPNSESMQRIPISRVIKHPQYGNGVHYHDVAILELKNMARISSSVQPTCLMTKPPSSLTSTRKPRLTILGWGAISLDGTTSTKLLKAEGLKFVEKNKCAERYVNKRGIPNGLDDGMICVVDANTTRKADTCWGDSGGPLMITPLKFSPLAGITSFGQACGGTIPGVYTSVYEYLNWIEEQVWPASN